MKEFAPIISRERLSHDLRDKDIDEYKMLTRFLEDESFEVELLDPVAFLVENQLSEKHTYKISSPHRSQAETYEDSSAAISVPEEVKLFVEKEQLQRGFRTVISLLNTHISGISRLQANLRRDEEADEQWVSILVTVTTSGREAAKADSRFLSAWVENASSKEADLIRVRYEFVTQGR